MLERIRKALLRVDYIKRAVDDYKRRQQKQKDDRLFAKCMYSSQSVRYINPIATLTVVGEGGKFEERLGGRIVETGWIDSVTWGRVDL